MTKYVAFLRGINSGKNPTTKMEVLRKAFEDMGFENVRTVIASGNVVFETGAADKKKLGQKIQKALAPVLGFESEVMISSIGELGKLMKLNPFKSVKLTPDARIYVTFVKDAAKAGIVFPYKGKGYTILGIFGGAVCSVINLADTKTPDLMKVLDKEFGKGNTTRGWKTIERILK